MTQCVIFFRNTGNGRLGFISDGDRPDEIAVFKDYEAASDFCRDGSSPVLRAFPYAIVELEDL